MTFRTRFAPSPTGPLHLGHAYSALLGHDMARAQSGEFLLRIEDIDQTRARAEWEEAIYEDLAWLGVTWDGDVLRQSDRLPVYKAALSRLWDLGLLYPCTCTRRDIQAAVTSPRMGPDGIVYPGTCRDKPRPDKIPTDQTLRLDMRQALKHLNVANVQFLAAPAPGTGSELSSVHSGETPVVVDGNTLITGVGDVVLARKEMATSYHLSVVIDDAAQGISDVVRGLDLYDATQIHAVLQALLDLPRPIYHHHRLVTDETGKRLAKRHDSKAIRLFRNEGASPDDIRRMVGI